MKKFLLSLIGALLIGSSAFAENSAPLNGFGSKNSSYSARSTSDGWKATNAAIIEYNGDNYITINGKTSAVGTLTSPTLTDGISNLKLSAAYTFSESAGLSLKAEIKQDGVTVASTDFISSIKQYESADFEWSDINVSGDFTIVITNNCPSKKSSNKDRATIYSLTWENNSDGPALINPNLNFEVNQYEMVAGESFDGLKLNWDYEVAPITYTSSNPSVATVDEATGSISALTAGTTTITASFEGNDEYRKSTASYTLTVVAAPYTNLKDVVTTAVKDEKVTIVGDFAVLYQSGSNTILTDGTSNILCYDYNLASYEVGTSIARIEGTVSPYYGLFELTSVTLTEGGNGATIDPVELTSFDSINYSDNLFDLVAVNGAEISGVSDKQATLELNGQSIALYNNFNIDNFSNLENVNLTGFVWRNNTTLQIDPISIVENTVEKIESGLAWTASAFTVMEGEEPEGYPTLINELGIDVVFTSSNEDVAIYEDGMLLIGEVGTTVITATPADTETYSGSAEFTVTVTAKPHLGAITVNGQTVADDDVISIVVNTEATFAAENAEIIEYEIAGPEGFEASDIVDADSYTFTPAAIGEYIVTISATGCNEEAEATFTINVTEVPAITEETLDFVNNDYGMVRDSNNTYNEDGFVLADTEFTYTVNKGNGNGTRLWSDGLRFYKGGSLTATAPLGYMIETIETLNKNGDAASISNLATSISINEVTATVKYTTTSKNSALPGLRVVVKPAKAPEVEGYSPELVYNDNVQTSTDEITGAITIIITHADKHASIYFKHTPDEVPAEVRRRIADHGDYTAADATLHDDGTSSVHTFTVPSAGTVDYYAYHAATDTKGELKSISVSADGGVTSISEITLDSNADANAIYDLQGRRVAKAARGLYISNGHKVYLR
ncbi:MAG: Ig-like domain-containing protein [Muribaculaceae bacterium]|nr:Ig-like domain-containing protein [Muribaculaceae bacterium]